MRSAVLIFCCLACVCEARRAKATTKQFQSSRFHGGQGETDAVFRSQHLAEQTHGPLEAFSSLLHVLSPVNAFRPVVPATVAARSSAIGEPRRLAVSPRAQASQASPFFAEGVRTQGRVLGIFGLWAGLIAYVALGAPGKDALSQAADADLLNKLISNPFDATVPPFFTCIFNYMGLWPAWYACVLLPGAAQQKPVPSAPFLSASVFFGMFALSPYLALREYREEGVTQADLNGLSRWTEGKVNAILLSIGAVFLAYYGITANDGNLAMSASQYSELFSKQLFVHVTSLDFLSLWALSYGALAEDAKRRGFDGPLPLFAGLPIVGHCAWLLVRPPLPED